MHIHCKRGRPLLRHIHLDMPLMVCWLRYIYSRRGQTPVSWLKYKIY